MSETRLETRFAELEKKGQKALITFLTAGYPSINETVDLMHGCVRGGSDVLELGVPFSDPMADGPVIQKASFKAIEQGVSLLKTLHFVEAFRKNDQTTPIVLMGYYNPIFSVGVERFFDQAQKAGVDGLIIVDLPVEEAGEIEDQIAKTGLNWIQLTTPTTTAGRMEKIAGAASGFVYYVSIAGVTGTKKAVAQTVAEKVDALRAHTRLPICVGFGIRSGQDAQEMGLASDGIIVGTALLEIVERGNDRQDRLTKLVDFVKTLRTGLDRVDTNSADKPSYNKAS